MIAPPPLSAPLRMNQVGIGVERGLSPDAEVRAAIARSLGLLDLPSFEAALSVKPAGRGWRLQGRVQAQAVQQCGVTLEPLPVTVDETFAIDLVEEAGEPEAEVEVTLDEDGPDVIEDGAIDLGLYAVEQLALALDPFPRKPGAVFEPPAQPAEESPFAVLRQFKRPDGADG